MGCGRGEACSGPVCVVWTLDWTAGLRMCGAPEERRWGSHAALGTLSLRCSLDMSMKASVKQLSLIVEVRRKAQAQDP